MRMQKHISAQYLGLGNKVVPVDILQEITKEFYKFHAQLAEEPGLQKALGDIVKRATQWDIAEACVIVNEEDLPLTYSRLQAQLWLIQKSFHDIYESRARKQRAGNEKPIRTMVAQVIDQRLNHLCQQIDYAAGAAISGQQGRAG